MSNCYVYVHRRADTGVAFYVGKGSGSRAHVTVQRSAEWNEHAAIGHRVQIVAYGLDKELALLAEIEMIAKLRSLGVSVCNKTAGGEPGPVNCRNPESIRRRAETQRGQKRPTVSAKLKGRPKTAEHKAAQSLSMKGRKAREETRQRMSASRKGKPGTWIGRSHREESKQKTSRALLSLPRKTCPHCGASGLDPGNAAKLHFNRCKRR